MSAPSSGAEGWVPRALGAAALVGYAAWVHGYLFPADGFIGHDFGGYLPALLDGVWWFRNNGFTVPWFTPGFCGGIPAFPEPQSAFWSLPQLLAFVVDPLVAAFLATTLFATVGWVGMVGLQRRVFGAGPAAATLGAVFFLFNDFFQRRTVTGSLGFQPFALVPLTAWVLLHPTGWALGRWRQGGSVLVGGLLIAAWFVGGLTTLMIPSALAVLALATITPDPAAATRRLLTRGLPAGLLAVALCAAKLNAAASFMRHFRRDAYPLPGFADPLTAASFTLRSLFWPSEALGAEAVPLLQNRLWAVDPQEWAYGLSVVPLLLLVLGAGGWALARSRGAVGPIAPPRRRALFGLLLLLALPVAFNTYSPGWNTLLKQLPVVGQTSFPFRWVVLAIPTVCVAAARVIDTLPRRAQWGAALGAGLAAVGLHLVEPDDWYRVEGAYYNPGPVRRAWHAPTPTVTRIVDYQTALAGETEFYSPNDFATKGWSAIDCYAPIFGYREEYLPKGSLHPGPALSLADGVWNVKNPACYVFPEENGCAPGDHFREDERAAAEAFLAWRPFPFAWSGRQAVANTVSEATALACLGGLGLLLWGGRRST